MNRAGKSAVNGLLAFRSIPTPTPIEQRLINAAADENADHRSILYQHTVLCQTYLPCRDPGPDVLTWTRSNGLVDLRMTVGEAKHPNGEWVQVPLPFGPKCRLVLMHLNQIALRSQSQHIEVEDSLTAFVRRVLKLDPKGRNIAMVKEQLRRLATSSIRLGVSSADRTTATTRKLTTRKLEIVTEFDVWFPRDERQRVLWPSYVELSHEYFTSLQQHGVPLDEGHIGALSHSALALDVYCWLAQRLHRIPANTQVFVSWQAMHAQFGQGYTGERGVRSFRAAFRVALKQVLALYRDARIDEGEQKPPTYVHCDGKRVWREPPASGLTLHHSRPPVPTRFFTIG